MADRVFIVGGVLLAAFLANVGPVAAQSAVQQTPQTKGQQALTVLSLADGKEIATWKFGDEQKSESKKRTFDAEPPLKEGDISRINVDLPNGLENENGHAFPDDKVQLDPILVGPKNAADLRVNTTLDSSGVDAGRYTGAVKVKGESVAPANFTIVATIKDPWLQALAWGFVGFLVGLFIKALTDIKAAREKNKDTKVRPYVKKYWSDPAFWLNVFVGGAAAFLAVFASYDGDDVWGSAGWDAATAFGLALVAATGGASISDLAKRFEPSPAVIAAA